MTDPQPGPDPTVTSGPDHAAVPPQPAGPDQAAVPPQPAGPDHAAVPPQATGPAVPSGFVPADGAASFGEPAPGPLAAYRVPLVAAGAVLGLLLAVVAGTGIYQAVKEDSGITACKAMAAGGEGENPVDDGDDELSEAEYKELREQFADSDHEKIREHGTALVDIVWEVSKMEGDEAAGALAYIGPMSTHMAGLKTACANEGIQVNLSGD
ncbi:hypothetical protein [Micromonospora sagamiensis]|uniref:Uncharacterized protein n=1 Tax=Micromonospora sagamiensis TaxID=47875 RepID=A0A562WC33_9ACTN|nr:hypothetical protein [Micromonospora sagamiensis]TWJ27830.1 hypothetical protein JD81_01330 [Micromonospora sagamiensis]BCL13282.1 hypothetical protein GCM10017556_10210 [Micromonospora sagamiensis]